MTQGPALCVICNPAAARGAAGRRLQRIQRLLGSRSDYWMSKEPGHAEELARQAAEAGYGTVAAAGGDGTIHEVANGLLRAEGHGAALGVIPLGSGNDYAASLGLPSHEAALCDILTSPETWQVDVGRVEDDSGRARYFVNTLGAGLSGAVVWEIRRIQRLSGMMLYAIGALRAIWNQFHCLDTHLLIDDRELAVQTLFLTVALGRREGGGFLVAPEAELDDGWFDYLHASRLSRWQALCYLPALARGRLPTDEPAIRRGRCQRLALKSAAPLTVHTDGEIFTQPDSQTRGVTVEMLARKLTVRCPQRQRPADRAAARSRPPRRKN